MAATGMTCPKCSGEWDVRERNGVMIEECVGCHGVFLDRGELERLIDAESDYLANLDTETDGPDGAGSYHGRHRRGIMHQIFTPAE